MEPLCRQAIAHATPTMESLWAHYADLAKPEACGAKAVGQ